VKKQKVEKMCQTKVYVLLNGSATYVLRLSVAVFYRTAYREFLYPVRGPGLMPQPTWSLRLNTLETKAVL
jgi:hypothetical protein